MTVHYAAAIRTDLAEAHRRAWDRLARPGSWWTGAERVAIAAETRHAKGCALCARRKAALSPYAVAGSHDHLGALPDAAVEAIHAIVAHPSRLTRRWYQGVLAGGLSDGQYVELVGVVAHVTAIDTFCRGIGVPPHPLPASVPGTPSRCRPSAAKQNEAWVPNIAHDDHGPDEADLFRGRRSNIRRALTLVPDEARGFFDLVETQYLPGAAMTDFAHEYRAITHAQVELVAARVSALNQCFYWTTSHALLLRASSNQTGETYQYGAITGTEAGEVGVPHAAPLMAFADAVLGEDDAPLAAARDALRTAMGEPALVDSAAVAALFNAIDRVADATGTQVEDEKAALTVELRARMGIDAYARGKEGWRMADKLNTGDTFPTLALTVSDGSTLRVPDGLGSGYRIILFYRGHWWPYCRRQLDGFAKIKAELDGIDARVAAASADPQDKAQEVAAGLNFPVAFGVTRGVADRIGAWWDPNRNIIQPSEFIVGGDGRVLSSTYSSGPIGRVEPGDAIRLIKFLEARKAKGS